MTALLRTVEGIDTAVGAAVETGVEEVQQALFTAFTDFGASVAEFAWMLTEARQTLINIQGEQARQGVEQRHQTDLARENLVKTNLVIQHLELLIGILSREPAADEATGPADPANEDPAPGPCPYMGLRSFRAEDAQWFFGRERLTADLLARLAEAPLLALVGASGSGKSSLLGAGLLPAAWVGTVPGAGSWTTVVLTPTSHPLEEPGSLPLLSHALPATWERRRGRTSSTRILWRSCAANDSPRSTGRRAEQAATTVHPEALPSSSHQAGFWSEVGRALARRGRLAMRLCECSCTPSS